MDIVKQTKAYSVVDMGAFSDISTYTYQPNPNFKIEGKVFLQELLGMTGTEISFNTMKPNEAVTFMHKHKKNEEVYLVLKGNGELLLNNDCISLKEGTSIRVHTDTARAIRNNGSESLIFVVIQAKENSIDGGKTSDGYVVDEKPNW